MTTCPSCKKEIAEGAVICKHCGAKLGTPERPKGVTLIAGLSFVGAVFALFALPSLNSYNSIILGMRVPVELAQLHAVIGIILSVYCGIAFLKLKETGRKVYLYYGAWSILNTIIAMFVLPSILRDMPEMRYLPSYAYEQEIIVVIGSGLLSLALIGNILYYLIRRKDYFVN